MSHAILTRADLYSQTQAAAILGVERRAVRAIAEALKVTYKNDPTRSGRVRLLDRDDVERIASALAMTVDWGDEPRC